MKPSTLLFVLFAAVAPLAPPAPAMADEPKKAEAGVPGPQELLFGDGAVRTTVDRDVTLGRLTLRLADPTVRLDGPPVLVLKTDAGPRELEMTPTVGEPGTWVATDEALKAPLLVAQLRVALAGRAYLADVPTPRPSEPKARRGGRRVTFPLCGLTGEAVFDAKAGTLTFHVDAPATLTEVVLLVTDDKGTANQPLAPVEGSPGVWSGTYVGLQPATTGLRLRITVDGKACEADLPLVESEAPRARRRVKVEGGPTFELVAGPKAGEYTFHAIEETLEGKTYVIEGPTIEVDARRHPLEPVVGEVRTWRLSGLDPSGIDSPDVALNFSIGGKSYAVRFDLTGNGTSTK